MEEIVVKLPNGAPLQSVLEAADSVLAHYPMSLIDLMVKHHVSDAIECLEREGLLYVVNSQVILSNKKRDA